MKEYLTKIRWNKMGSIVLIILALAFGALLLIRLYSLLVLGMSWYLDPNSSLTVTQRKDIVLGLGSIGQAVTLSLAGTAGFIGLYFTARNLNQTRKSTEQTIRLTEEGQITDRFTRAIDQLGAAGDEGQRRIEIRLGGIYGLEQIANDSPEKYYRVVMEILAAYVRENAAWKSSYPPANGAVSNRSVQQNELAAQDSSESLSAGADDLANSTSPSADIEAIVNVIGRREINDPFANTTQFFDLQRTDLRGGNYVQANLQHNMSTSQIRTWKEPTCMELTSATLIL